MDPHVSELDLSIPRPGPDEFAPFYAGYVAAAGDGELPAILLEQAAALPRALQGLNEERALHRYAEGKWSVKQVIGHLTDAERIFAYRALRVARGDATPLPGWDENEYADAAGSDRRPLHELVTEFLAVRVATLQLLGGFGPEVWVRRGTANGAPVSVRALAWIIGGHTQHHLRILAERYGISALDG